jgi:hypothetical protein
MPNPPRKITHDGKSLTLKEWAAITGLHPETIRSRIDHQGYTPAEALTSKLQTKFRGRRTAEPAPVPCPKYKRHAKGQAYAAWRAGGRQHFTYFGPLGGHRPSRSKNSRMAWLTSRVMPRFFRFAARRAGRWNSSSIRIAGMGSSSDTAVLGFLPMRQIVNTAHCTFKSVRADCYCF